MVAENGFLGTRKNKLLTWTAALHLQQARQRADSWAECATAIHGWTLRLNGTDQKHQTSCHSLQDITAPGYYTHLQDIEGLKWGCRATGSVFCAVWVITKHLEAGRPIGLLYLSWQDAEEKENPKRIFHNWLCFLLLTPFEKQSCTFLHFQNSLCTSDPSIRLWS